MMNFKNNFFVALFSAFAEDIEAATLDEVKQQKVCEIGGGINLPEIKALRHILMLIVRLCIVAIHIAPSLFPKMRF